MKLRMRPNDDDEIAKVQPEISNDISNTQKLHIAREDCNDLAVSLRDEDKMVNGDDHVPRIQLEDLIGMIKIAEKNIVLLNEARISAVEDLNKILAEKEVLQRHVNVLEVKLAETEGHIYAATQEKQQTRNELDKQKNGMNKETEDHVYHAHTINTNSEEKILTRVRG